MSERMRVSGSISDSIDDGVRPLASHLTTLLASKSITSYLESIVTDDVSLIVSTVRKGSWIMEDYLRRSGKVIPHITSEEIFDSAKYNGNILIFDDSVHTGETILSIVSRLPNKACNVKVCCILLNIDAKNKLSSAKISNISYYKLFEKYELYNNKNGYDGELLPECQSYCYSHFLIPYISGLTFNYSPDYESLSIKVKSDTISDRDRILDIILNSVNGIIVETFEVYRDHRILRKSSELKESFSSDLFRRNLSGIFETDVCKLRMSAVTWAGYIEVVLTPVVSCRFKSDNDCSDFLDKMSSLVLDILSPTIIESLIRSGLLILGEERFKSITDRRASID